MNDILKFNVFGENFEIKTNDLENTNFIFNILGSNCKNNHIANKESYIFEYNFDNNYIPKIHKKGIKYELLIGSFIYDKNNQEYNIFYKDGSYAKWLFLKKKFIFYIKKIYNIPPSTLGTVCENGDFLDDEGMLICSLREFVS